MNDFSNNDAEPRQIKQFDVDFYQAMIDTLQEGAFVIESKKFKLVNQAFCQLTGCHKKVLIGQQFGSFIYPQDTPISFEEDNQEPSITRLKTPMVKKRLENGRAEYHLVVAHISGSAIPIEINSQHFIDAKGQLYQIAYIKKKRVEQALNKALRSSENELQWLIAHLPSLYLQINADGNINRVSHFAENLLGFEPGTLIGLPLGDIIANNQEQTRALADIIQNKGEVAKLKIKLRSKKSDPISLEISGYAKNDKDGKLITIELFTEPQAKKSVNTDSDHAQEKLQADTSVEEAVETSSQTISQADSSEQTVVLNKADLIRDPLTRLINHIAFEEHLAKSIRRARRHHSQLWVLFVSLQGFASTVQQHGEHTGRTSLVQFSQRLQSFFRETDIVASIEPGQFAILLDDYTSKLSLSKLIGKLQKVMDKKVAIRQYSNGFSFSIGTANFPEDGINSKDLMEHAQSKMSKQQISTNHAGS